jgi:hypothetical protein
MGNERSTKVPGKPSATKATRHSTQGIDKTTRSIGKATKDETLHVRIDSQTKAAFVGACDERELSTGQVIRKLIKTWLQGLKGSGDGLTK